MSEGASYNLSLGDGHDSSSAEGSHTRFSFYKNILYKNIEDEMGQKVKNILRICSS